MTIWRLVIREIQYRKINFILGLVAVAVAVGTTTAALALLNAHRLRSEAILSAKQAEAERQMATMADDYRKITKKLGFNILVLPKAQDLGDLYVDSRTTATMPESYIDDLAGSGIMSIRHLLPSLEQRFDWPEQDRTIILAGVRGEVPFRHLKPKEPILMPVPAGTAVVGYEICRSLGLTKGDEITLDGRLFRIHQCRDQQGNRDDVTIWVPLDEAQSLLGRPGEITGILALKCHCYGLRLGEVREEIERLLPSARVVEFGTKVITRAEARDRATDTARLTLQTEADHRATLQRERERLAAVVVPVTILVSAVMIGLLSFLNVRDRADEIGVLRAVGLGTGRLLAIFLAKAGFTGLVGAAPGLLAGYFIGAAWGQAQVHGLLLTPHSLLAILFAAPVLTAAASWLPALSASRQDPAAVLRGA